MQKVSSASSDHMTEGIKSSDIIVEFGSWKESKCILLNVFPSLQGQGNSFVVVEEDVLVLAIFLGYSFLGILGHLALTLG